MTQMTNKNDVHAETIDEVYQKKYSINVLMYDSKKYIYITFVLRGL